jgi:uncharacterized protein YndB with AHSA1/START domain
MSEHIQDRIERTITINAPIERVFQGVREDMLGKTVGEIAAGAHVHFDFGEWGRSSVHIIAFDPPRYVAYRWVPGMIFEGDIYEKGSTLVEITLKAIEGGTELTLVESGFASLPTERYSEAIENNSAGWEEELANLTAYVQNL